MSRTSCINPESVADFDDVVTEYIKNGNPDVYKADTIGELAGMLGIDPEALEETVSEYNDMCKSADTKFYKSRKYMKPIVKAPFYAGKFRPGAYGDAGRYQDQYEGRSPRQGLESRPGPVRGGDGYLRHLRRQLYVPSAG